MHNGPHRQTSRQTTINSSETFNRVLTFWNELDLRYEPLQTLLPKFRKKKTQTLKSNKLLETSSANISLLSKSYRTPSIFQFQFLSFTKSLNRVRH